jgi:hypothetical protein
MHAAELASTATWPGVDELVRQARQAYAHGLDVAAAAAAGVAAEQAVVEALEATVSLQTEGRPQEREGRLFDRLPPTLFRDQPIDHSATRAALSNIRSLGNVAAHEGTVDNALVQEALMQLLPQALVSLFGAVEGLRG